MMVQAITAPSAVTLGDLLDHCTSSLASLPITQISMDSRDIRPGALFMAVAGHAQDGRQFIGQAAANGAVAVVAEPPVQAFVDQLAIPVIEQAGLAGDLGVIASRFYGAPSAELSMVGVTGTNGKTTVSRLIGQLSRGQGRDTGVIGTLGATTDDSVCQATNTTPDPVSLQRQLAQWSRTGVSCVAMEVSSHALVQGRVNGVQFDVAVLTNLTRDHLDYHGDMNTYGNAKSRLFTSSGLKFAVINVDDPFGAELISQLGDQVQVVSYSAAGKTADVRAERCALLPNGFSVDLQSPWGAGSCDCSLPGDFNVENLLAALSAAACLGCDWQALLKAVPSLHAVPGRMQPIVGACKEQVVVDYAHTPDALERALQALRGQIDGQLICVFGCGGNRDRGKRAAMGAIACRYSDHVIVTSDNPREESPTAIIADIVSGCSGSFETQENRASAIEAAVAMAAAGDCVLVAGKGHENYQLINGQQLEFSDAEHASNALKRKVSK